MIMNKFYISIVFLSLLLSSCETIKKDEDQIKKIAQDMVDEEIDKVMKEIP